MCVKIISYNAIMHAHNVIHWILIQFLKKVSTFVFLQVGIAFILVALLDYTIYYAVG